MKLVISYDLPDKIKEANYGFTLKKASKRILFYTGINTIIGTGMNLASNADPSKYLLDVLCYLGCHTSMTGLFYAVTANAFKLVSSQELEQLAQKMNQIHVNATKDNLLNSYPYKTEYSMNVENGNLEQRKYINIPVNDDWGDREMSIVQEHVLGSKEYVLSLGAPEEKKTYSLGGEENGRKVKTE